MTTYSIGISIFPSLFMIKTQGMTKFMDGYTPDTLLAGNPTPIDIKISISP